MKEFSIIFAICLTVVLGEKVQDLQKYEKIDSKNDTWASMHPGITGFWLEKLTELFTREELKLCNIIKHTQFEYFKTFEILDNNGMLIRDGSLQDDSYDGIFELCMKEEVDCDKAACVIISIYYSTFTRAYSNWSCCMSKYYLGYKDTVKIETSCPIVCYILSESYLIAGKVPDDHYIHSSQWDRKLNDHKLDALKDSYEACKTVNDTCPLFVCMYKEYPKLLKPVLMEMV